MKAFLTTRWPVLLATLLVAVAVFGGWHLRGSWWEAWWLLNVPAMSGPYFADLRTVTHSIDCLRHGSNPYLDRSFDPWDRLYNYPALWLKLGYLGISSASTIPLAIAIIVLTFTALLLLFRPRTLQTKLLVLAAATSNSLLFAVAQGNVDLVIFSLLTLTCLFLDRLEGKAKTLTFALATALLTALKVFPIAACIVLLRSRKSLLSFVSVCLASLLALLLTSGRELRYVFGNTPQPVVHAYGSLASAAILTAGIAPRYVEAVRAHHSAVSAIALLVGLAALIFGWISRAEVARRLPLLDFTTGRGWLAVACLAIYCFTFLAGANYGYRLIFLLGALSFLLDSLDRASSRTALVLSWALALLMGLPITREHKAISLLHVALDISLFTAGCLWLGASFGEQFSKMEAVPSSYHEPSA